MKNTITLLTAVIMLAVFSGCGKPETQQNEKPDADWAPEMVDDHAGHDHGDHEGHDHSDHDHDDHAGHNH